MKKTRNVRKRILSLFLTLALVIGMVPVTGVSVSAAPSEALTMSKNSSKHSYNYSNNLQLYFKYNNYIYKAVFTNLKNISKFDVVYTDYDNSIHISRGPEGGRRLGLVQTSNTFKPYATLNQLPTQTGKTVSFYLTKNHSDYTNNITKSVVTFTCMGVGTPTWTWNETSSAAAKFTSTDNGATLTVGAKISSSTQPAASCVNKDKTTYTAKVNVYGTEYTNTKTVDGAAGPHSFAYSGVGNVITETCKNNCGHSETATLKVAEGASFTYTGSEIKPLTVDYSSGWQGGELNITYSNNINAGTATGSITIGDVTATKDFTITNGTMTGITADPVSVPYDGDPHSITVKNVPAGATVSYSTDGETYSKTNPAFTGIGTNTVYYKVEKANYDTVTGSAAVTISRAENEWTSDPGIEGWTYGETAKTPDKGTPKFGSDVKVEYKPATENDNQYSTIVPTNAGNYKVRFSVEGNENYTGLSKEADLTIAKKEVTVTAENNSKTYGETDPTLTWKRTSGELVGADVLTGISVSRATGEDVNTYSITASQTAGANPNYDITFVPGTFTIHKKTIGIRWGITDFTYNGETKLPAATATGVEYEDEIGLTVTGGQINAGTGYTATVTGITGDKKDNYQLPADVTKIFSIAKADQTAPGGLVGTPEDIDERENGTITGVTSAMEYRKNKETGYTDITGTELTNLADGTYYIRYKADSNHNASADTPVILSNDRKLTVTVPEVQTGYTLTVDKDKLVWKDSVELAFALADGYSKLDTFAVKVNGNSAELDKDGKYTVTNAQTDVTVTVEGVADITAPDAEIALGTNKWNKFFNSITFGLFFKDTQSVTITADDKGSGVDKVYYHLSTTELTEEQVKALSGDKWTEYTGAWNLDPQDEYIIYAKAADRAGNTTYISSDKGIIIDSIAPVVSGIANGETHYGDTTFAVSDKHLDQVTVDGDPVTLTDGKYTITADGQEHTIVAADKSGNASAEIKITVITIASLDDSIESITTDNVKSSDREAIGEVQSLVDRLISSGKTFTETEQAGLDAMKADTKALLEKISSVSAEMTDLTASVNAYDVNRVKSDDKAAINGLIKRIDTLLNGNNLTADEKAAMTALKTTAQGLIKKIDDTAEKVNDLTERVNDYDKDKVTSEDKQDITDLIADMDKLLEEENLNDAEKAELEQVKAAAEALVKKIDDTADEIKAITEDVKDYSKDSVKSDDKKDLENLIKRIDTLTETDNVTETEKTELADVKAAAQELIGKIDETSKKVNDLTEGVNDYDKDKVTSEDKQDITDLIADMDKLLEEENLNDAEKENLKKVKDTAEALIDRIAEATDSSKTDNTDKVKDVTSDNVKTNDKANLEKARDDLKKALEDYKDNLTEDEKKNIQDEIDRIEKVLETLAKNEKAKADSKNNSPSTGDNGNIWMWFVLLFVSSGLLGVTAYSRKKKNCE